MHYTRRDLERHLAEEHKQSPFAQYLKEIVYGGNDGIVTTFAVVAGFAGAGASVQLGELGYLTVLLFGLANLFADGASMGLGNFLAVRADQDQYRQHKLQEMHEIKHNPEMEKAESIELLYQRGFTKEQAHQLVDIYSTNKEYWVDFMMRYELDMQNPEGENPWLNSIATFLSFVAFGSIPLLPFIITSGYGNTFLYAIIATASALLLLGFLRWKVTKESMVRSIGEILLVGGTSAAIAFFIGTFFRV